MDDTQHHNYNIVNNILGSVLVSRAVFGEPGTFLMSKMCENVFINSAHNAIIVYLSGILVESIA